jgi:hypothetical protein
MRVEPDCTHPSIVASGVCTAPEFITSFVAKDWQFPVSPQGDPPGQKSLAVHRF